jgi:hypothetical protein
MRVAALAAMLAAVAVVSAAEQPSGAAVAGFNAYVEKVEARLNAFRNGQRAQEETILAPVDWKRVRSGEVLVEELTPKEAAELPGALLHDWRGTAFVPGATAEDFERVLKDFAGYPRYFAPQVEEARVLEQEADHASVALRVKQKHVITVVLDTAYDITYARLGAERGMKAGTIDSRSTRVEEIGANGRALSAADEHGFLWRMNTYWSYEERDGGVYMQIESVSLTRSIPTGLGWAVGPFVESVPRESMEFTLQAVMKAVKNAASQPVSKPAR